MFEKFRTMFIDQRGVFMPTKFTTLLLLALSSKVFAAQSKPPADQKLAVLVLHMVCPAIDSLTEECKIIKKVKETHVFTFSEIVEDIYGSLAEYKAPSEAVKSQAISIVLLDARGDGGYKLISIQANDHTQPEHSTQTRVYVDEFSGFKVIQTDSFQTKIEGGYFRMYARLAQAQ